MLLTSVSWRSALPRCGQRAGRVALIAAACAVAGCDLPTALPIWDATFRVPAKGTTLSVSQLLPGSVTVSGDRTAFVVAIAPVNFSRSLGEMCPPCAAFNGLLVPKPSFTATVPGTLSLPAEVTSAALAGGSVAVSVQNTLGFDPLRPSAATTAPRGTITIDLTAGGTSLGSATVNGTDTAFPSGSTLSRTLTLVAGNLSGPISVTLTLNSPAGDPVVINTNGRVSVTASPSNIRVSNARVSVASRAVSAEVELKLEDVSQSVVKRILGGSLILAIGNPFGVTGPLTLSITGPNPFLITKQVTLSGQATQNARVDFTEAELQSFIGRVGARLTVRGTLNGPAGGVLVTPVQVVNLAGQFELKLSVGGEE